MEGIFELWSLTVARCPALWALVVWLHGPAARRRVMAEAWRLLQGEV
jgi:hypothetical protein